MQNVKGTDRLCTLYKLIVQSGAQIIHFVLDKCVPMWSTPYIPTTRDNSLVAIEGMLLNHVEFVSKPTKISGHMFK